MKYLKYKHQSILPLWGRVKLNFRHRYGKPNIYFNNSSCYQLFSSNSQKLSLWCKKIIIPHHGKKSFLTHMDLYDPYMVLYIYCGIGSNLMENQIFILRTLYRVFSSNSQKLSLWCKKKKSSMQVDLYDPYKSPYIIS